MQVRDVAVNATRRGTGSLRDALRGLAALELLPLAQRRLADEAADKLAGLGVYVAVVGEFKRGKTTLINALLGAPLLPTGVIPVTAVPALVRFGLQPRAMLRFLDDSEVEVDLPTLAEYLTEQQNPGNRKGVREAVIEYPAGLLESGIVLVDTPGTGSVHVHNTEATAAFLPRVDVALLVLSADAPLSESETRLFGEVTETAANVAVCLNKVDVLTAIESREAMDFIRPRIAVLSGRRDVVIFAVSAREAVEHQDGGLAAVRSWLERDVAGSQESLATQRGGHLAIRLLSLVDSVLQLEAAAAAKPAQEAAVARQAFVAAQEALAREVDEEAILLLAACRRAAETVVEPGADRLRVSLPPVLLGLADDRWPECLETTATGWSRDIAGALTAALGGPVDRHADRTHALIARFVEQAGEAFGVELPAAFDDAPVIDVDAVRMSLADEPGALAMGVRQLRARIPGGLGQRWRERARRELAVEDADRLAGRLRYATVQSVDRIARQWMRDSAGSMQALSDSLAGAVARAEEAARSQGGRAASDDVGDRVESVRRALRET
jgi:GTP-binding protein EngB required for normal cell division